MIRFILKNIVNGEGQSCFLGLMPEKQARSLSGTSVENEPDPLSRFNPSLDVLPVMATLGPRTDS